MPPTTASLAAPTDATLRAKASPRVAWLFLDLNSYFASVEQELRPELRGRPVAVVPVTADSGAVIAASYEAKAFGIKTGTKVGEARQLCPQVVFVEARHREYVDFHRRILKAVDQCVPISAVLSIDEMACALMGREQELMNAMRLAREVKAIIRAQVGSTLRCSIGLAPNRYLAKIASDMEKPDGLVALTPDILAPALAGLGLRDLPGIGARMERRLHAAGIRTMPQLLALPREELRRVWNGVSGDKLWFWLRGEDFHDRALEHQKSVSQSHVLPPALRNPEGAYAVLHKLLHKAAMRMRAERLWTSHVSLSIKFAVREQAMQRRHGSGIPQVGWSQSCTIVECQDTQTLIEALAKLWAMRPQETALQSPFYVGVGLGNLVPDHLHTLSLFDDAESGAKRNRIASAMDAMNNKYGLHTLAAAGMLPAGTHAATRIAFTSIPKLFER